MIATLAINLKPGRKPIRAETYQTPQEDPSDFGDPVPATETTFETIEDRMGFFRRKLLPLTLIASGIFHAEIGTIVKKTEDLLQVRAQKEEPAALREYRETIRKKIEAVRAAVMPDEDKDVITVELESVAERNVIRAAQAEKVQKEAAALKESFLADPRYTANFNFRFDLLFQGVEPLIVNKAAENLRILLNILKENRKQVYTSDIVATYPAGGQEDTLAHPSDALALMRNGILPDCEGRWQIYAMLMTEIYPGTVENLYVQEFGDHARLVYRSGTESYVVEGNLPAFPDDRTKTVASRIMPLNEYWKKRLGVDEKELKRVEYLGPPAPPPPKISNIVNDNLSAAQEPPARPLGKFRTEPMKKDPEERRASLNRLNRQINLLRRGLFPDQELYLMGPRLAAGDAKLIMQEFRNRDEEFYSEFDDDAVEIALEEQQVLGSNYSVFNPGITAIDERLAAQLDRFARYPLYLGLPELEEIDARQIKLLYNLNSRGLLAGLNLFRVRKMDRRAWQALSHLNLTVLYLPILEDLSAEDALDLSKINPRGFSLGIRSLNPENAKNFRFLDPDSITFTSLTDLPPESARYLCPKKLCQLEFFSLKNMSPQTLMALLKDRTVPGRHRQGDPLSTNMSGLWMSSINALGLETAEVLAGSPYDYVTLGDAAEMSVTEAKILVRFKGRVDFMAWRRATPEIKQLLAPKSTEWVLDKTEPKGLWDEEYQACVENLKEF